MREHREAREDVEVFVVVGRADEEEVPRRGAVGRAEEDRPRAASVRDEALLEEVGVVVARVQERRTRADGGRGGLLAGDELPEEALGVVDEARALGERRHVADEPALRLGGDREVDRLRLDEPRHAPGVAPRAAALVDHQAVLLVQFLARGRQQVALRPLVEGRVLEVPFAAADLRVDLAALRDVLEVVRRDVHVRGRGGEGQELVAHRAPPRTGRRQTRTSSVSASTSTLAADETDRSRSCRNR